MAEHILVELDFIPVEERLPDEEMDEGEEIQFPIILNGNRIAMAWLMNWDDEGDLRWDIKDVSLKGDVVTHWSETPQIKGA